MTRLLAQLFARDPRKEVRFPDVPLEQALLALQRLQVAVAELKAAPPPATLASSAPMPVMPPVIAQEPAVADPVPEPAPVLLPPPAPVTPENNEELASSIAGLATQVWRARSKALDPETGEPRDDMRRIYRHIEAAYDVFAQMGVTLNDWIKQPYDAGLPVKVLTYQPTPGILRDTVLEAVRPTVVWNDRLLQMGEVIVGTPADAEEKSQ